MITSVLPTYARAPVSFERGEGAYLYTSDGKRYLDFTSGVAVVSLGHANPRLVKALTAQAEKLWHCSNLFEIAGQKRVAQRLIDACFADTVFFCNSGAEAMECAIKMARKYHAATGHPERYALIACTGSFHGRTLATLAAAGNEKYLAGFGPAGSPASTMSPSAISTRCAPRSRPQTAGIIVEPVQGEGGLATADRRTISRACARSATSSACCWSSTKCRAAWAAPASCSPINGTRASSPTCSRPAKGLGGGFPVGACLATEERRGRHDRRHARLDLRRQSAGHGGRRRRARR